MNRCIINGCMDIHDGLKHYYFNLDIINPLNVAFYVIQIIA